MDWSAVCNCCVPGLNYFYRLPLKMWSTENNGIRCFYILDYDMALFSILLQVHYQVDILSPGYLILFQYAFHLIQYIPSIYLL